MSGPYSSRSWFSEIDMFPGLGSIARYRYTPGTGHYTQVIVRALQLDLVSLFVLTLSTLIQMTWSSVSLVGCGYITYSNQETTPLVARYYVCDYGPGGNRIGDKMYQPGRACSQCPSGRG